MLVGLDELLSGDRGLYEQFSTLSLTSTNTVTCPPFIVSCDIPKSGNSLSVTLWRGLAFRSVPLGGLLCATCEPPVG